MGGRPDLDEDVVGPVAHCCIVQGVDCGRKPGQSLGLRMLKRLAGDLGYHQT